MNAPKTPRKPAANASAKTPRKTASKLPAAPVEPAANPISDVPYGVDEKPAERRRKPAGEPVEERTIVTVPGDTWWRVALRSLGVPNTPLYTFQISEERNRLIALNPDLGLDLPPGSVVRI
jgi:hypothetical protein